MRTTYSTSRKLISVAPINTSMTMSGIFGSSESRSVVALSTRFKACSPWELGVCSSLFSTPIAARTASLNTRTWVNVVACDPPCTAR